MRNQYFFAALVISLLGGGLTASAEIGGGSSETSATQAYRDQDRFFRRVLIEGSVANAGYEGGDSSRYTKPNGYTAGMLVDLLGNRALVVETGAMYRQFGTTFNNGVENHKYTADYLSIPLSLKYYFSGQESTSFYLKAGVMGSRLLSNTNLYPTSTVQIGTRAWETALLGGVGGKFQISPSTDVLVEADYTRALDSAFSGSNTYRSDLSGALGLAINL